MKITNDIISFDDADFVGLSDFAKKALPTYVGAGIEFKNAFATALNLQIRDAKRILVQTTQTDAGVDLVLKKLSVADRATFDQALTAANAVLVSVVAESPVQDPVVAESPVQDLKD